MTRLIYIFAFFHCAKGNMTVTPRNTVVLAGEKIELECRVDRNSTVTRWDVVKPSAVFETQTIAVKSAMTTIPRLGADVDSTGSGLLYYNSTELGDAGNYTCRAHIGFDQEKIIYSAQLIVLESLPICTFNYIVDNDSSITMQCSVNFRGFWSPTMEWKQHDGDKSGNITGHDVKGVIESRTFPNSSVTSSLTVNRNSLDKGTYFTCRTYFERKSDGSVIMNATNIPDFVYVWFSTNYSNDPTTSKAMMDRQGNRKHYLRVALWSSVSVALVLMVAVVAVAIGCHMRNRKIVRSLPEKQDNRYENENGSASPAYYASDTMPELLTYAEIDELQISPMDYPPETTPRLNKEPDDSATCIQEPDGSNSVEHNSDLVDTSNEIISKMESVHDCVATPVANGKGDTLKPNPLYHTLDPIQSVLSPSIVESQISATL